MLDLGEREIKRNKENPLKFHRKLGSIRARWANYILENQLFIHSFIMTEICAKRRESKRFGGHMPLFFTFIFFFLSYDTLQDIISHNYYMMRQAFYEWSC
jgi:hypothetical protein